MVHSSWQLSFKQDGRLGFLNGDQLITTRAKDAFSALVACRSQIVTTDAMADIRVFPAKGLGVR